jgi:hypothetical protein
MLFIADSGITDVTEIIVAVCAVISLLVSIVPKLVRTSQRQPDKVEPLQPMVPVQEQLFYTIQPSQSPTMQAVPSNASPMPQPRQEVVPLSVHSHSAKTQGKGFFRYPILGIVSIITLVLLIVSMPLLPAKTPSVMSASVLLTYIVFGISGITMTCCWVYGIVKVIQLRRWGWLVAMVPLTIYAVVVFSIWGPNERRSLVSNA